VVLDFHSYEIGEPKWTGLNVCGKSDYGAPLYVTFLLKDEKAAKEKVFMGELPLMTPQGTFVINVRSASLFRSCTARGIASRRATSEWQDASQLPRHPGSGSWYEAQFDTSDLLYVYLDRKSAAGNF